MREGMGGFEAGERMEDRGKGSGISGRGKYGEMGEMRESKSARKEGKTKGCGEEDNNEDKRTEGIRNSRQ